MYSFAIADGAASEALWAWARARWAVTAAIDALDTAGACLVGIIADTGWESDGVRALTDTLDDLEARSGDVSGGLRVTEWELGRGWS